MQTCENICRTCAKQVGSTPCTNIFITDQVLGISLAAMIMSCSHTTVAETDGLPHKICEGCRRELRSAYVFGQRTDEAFRKLMAMQQRLKEEEDTKLTSEYFIEDDTGPTSPTSPANDESELQPYETVIVDGNIEVTLDEDPGVGVDADQVSESGVEEVQGYEVLEVACDKKGIRYKCSVCDKTFSRQTHVKRHQLTHSSIKPYKCSKCDKAFVRNDHLLKHETTHSEARPFSCDLCSKTFARDENLKLHKQRHQVPTNKRRQYSCNLCGNSFTTARYLEVHIANHNEKKELKCKFCSEVFDNRNDLIKHGQTHNKPYLCTLCGQRFLRKDYLRVHMRRHTGFKPFKCRFCEKAFPRSTDLTIHEKYHTNEKTHLCNICGKGFARSYNLQIHSRTHTGVKPYACTYCVKTFAQKPDLNTHIRRHTGELLRCEICNQGFLRRYMLTKHQRQVHNLDIKTESHRVQKFIPQPPEKLLESLTENEQRLKLQLDTFRTNLRATYDEYERADIDERISHAERELADVLEQRSLILSHIETKGVVQNESLVIVNVDPAQPDVKES